MCEWCLKHGANGKWYMNAKNYINEQCKELDTVIDYLEVLWGNLERVYLGKAMGLKINDVIGNKLQMPILGRMIKWNVNRLIKKEKNANPRSAEGHFGQVIPLEEAKVILTELTETAVLAKYPCRFTHRGISVSSCIGFSALSDVLTRLPRFIPENGLQQLDNQQSIDFLEKMNLEGKVHPIWAGPLYPFSIAAMCSCEYPLCLGFRTRLDFGINTVYKGEYVAIVDPNQCNGCESCTSRCQFGALSFNGSTNTPIIDATRCFGCGLCKESCEHHAIKLFDRNSIPLTAGVY